MTADFGAVRVLRRLGQLLRWLGPAWIGGLVALIVSIPLTLAMLGVNFGATMIDRAPIRQHVVDAFAAGQLRAEYFKPGEIDTGSHPYNDCLILHLVLRDDASNWERALAPRVNAAEANPCLAVQTLAEQAEVGLAQPAIGYSRYLHGHTAFASLMLNAFSLETARELMMLANVIVLGGLFVVAVALGWRASLRGERAQSSTAGYVAVAAAGFLLFFGEADYGMSLSHFPADMMLFAYLWVALLVNPSRWTRAANICVHAVFGVLTAWMEFLTGGIPLSVCLIAYVFASHTFAPGALEHLRRFFVAVAAFAAAIVGVFAFKMLLTALALGPETVSNFAQGLQARVVGAAGSIEGGNAISLVEAWKELFWYAGNVGAGSRELGRILIVLSFGATAYGLFVIVRRKLVGESMIQPGLLIVAFMTITFWHIVFYPHTAVHAHFMVRTMVGLFFSSAMLMVCLHREQIGLSFRKAGALLAP